MNAMEQKNKMVIYQVFPRWFGNLRPSPVMNGSLAENGVCKFSAFTPLALSKIKELGVTHVWYTGVIEHATKTDYTMFGIRKDHSAVVKGKAGSPYAIKDYYDIDPDLGGSLVPNFILQPLVENSLLHGLKNKGYRGEVVITAKKEGNAIEILIRDSGSGFTDGRKDIIDEMLLHYDKKQAKLEGNSIGILNVQKRIKLLCGPKYGLSYMENETGGVTARLLLPHGEDEK